MACALPANNLGAYRVIALVDMDSFECQVYKRMFPENDYYGQPWIVVDKTGRIVSATHEARELGISRDIRLNEAKRIAGEKKVALRICHKPNEREKPDNKEVRYASWDIVDALKEYAATYAFGVVIECSSSDEFYLDITDEVTLRLDDAKFTTITESRTFLEMEEKQVSGEELKKVIFSGRYKLPRSEEIDQERRLLCGGLIMQELNNFVFARTKLIGSVGIGSNKLMAKLGVSMNKPNGITILPDQALSRLGKDMRIEKIPGFGGSTGQRIKDLYGVSTMYELTGIELNALERGLGSEKGLEVYFKCRGISEDPVIVKFMTAEVSCGKSYYHGQIRSDELLYYYMHQLIEEMYERLEEERLRHIREPKTLRFSANYVRIRGYAAGEKNKISTWSHSTDYQRDEPLHKIGYAVIMKALNTNRVIDYRKIKIVRLEVRAKGFVTIA